MFLQNRLNGFLETSKTQKIKTMSQSFCKIWIHAIWSTKDQMPLIHSSLEEVLYNFISVQLYELSCPVRIINGTEDHVHCLFLLNPQKSVADVLKQVKGSSSHFINQNNLIAEKFAWQPRYSAFSVSDSLVSGAVSFIQNQKVLHESKSFIQEYYELLKIHGIENNYQRDFSKKD